MRKMQTIQMLVFIAGVYAAVQAARHYLFFRKCDTSLSWAMALLLAEQMVTSVCTLIFAGASILSSLTLIDPDCWDAMPEWIATSLRMAMFSIMIFSTWRLSKEIEKIQAREGV
jgi:hypothetical protein